VMLKDRPKQESIGREDGAARGTSALLTLADVDAALAKVAARLATCDAALAGHAEARTKVDWHPHYHWWTSGALAVATGLTADDILAMAGLLTMPWPDYNALLRRVGGSGYLMRRWATMIASNRAAFETAGKNILLKRGMLIREDVPARWRAEPKFGCGAVFVAHGFDAADRDAWSGLWTLNLRTFEQRCSAAANGRRTVAIGTLLAKIVADDRAALAQRGARSAFLRAQAAYQDDCLRFARWQAEHPDHPWPSRIANARQGYLTRSTAKALEIAAPVLVGRGEAAAWLNSHDANVRFRKGR
jgi:hypothetical protein